MGPDMLGRPTNASAVTAAVLARPASTLGSTLVRLANLLIITAALAVTATGCSASHPDGTIAEDDLPGNPKVSDVLTDVQAGQVPCQDVNDAEDNYVMTPSQNFDPDRRAAVSYVLAGRNRETVSDSVWRLTQPEEAVAQVAAGLRKCVKSDPGFYQRFSIDGHPGALGYTAKNGKPTPRFTRRILVPLTNRVVIVTTTRDHDNRFSIPPEQVLEQCLTISANAPKA